MNTVPFTTTASLYMMTDSGKVTEDKEMIAEQGKT